ncbi:MAG: transposase [Candidatus Accumulibacter sp.]|nr:transposase [Accumulibacter sp.]
MNFLKAPYRSNPGRELRIIADNLSAHKHHEVQEWVKKRRRLSLHFTPTYASWLEQIEIWFNIFTKNVIKGGIWPSKQALVKQIMQYIRSYNQSSAPDVSLRIFMHPSLFSRRGGQNTRHSRAGLESRKGVEYWIPAYAGMTGWETLRVIR